MVARRVTIKKAQKRTGPRATTPEGRENQLIAAAVDLAEQQFEDGTASAQVITHYLKLGSSREKLEQAKIAKENELLEVRMETMAAAGRVEELYAEAIIAMRQYSGSDTPQITDDFND